MWWVADAVGFAIATQVGDDGVPRGGVHVLAHRGGAPPGVLPAELQLLPVAGAHRDDHLCHLCRLDRRLDLAGRAAAQGGASDWSAVRIYRRVLRLI
eukprot:1459569-Pyramimonas_sp.AAC.1